MNAIRKDAVASSDTMNGYLFGQVELGADSRFLLSHFAHVSVQIMTSFAFIQVCWIICINKSI